MTQWNNATEAHRFIDYIFLYAARIAADGVWQWVEDPFSGTRDYIRTHHPRPWFRREYTKQRLHDAVHKMMTLYRPDDWQQLLLEWPHKSETDPNRLAYTRDERSGEADRQVVTSVGKYLTRHFRYAPDYIIRDVVAEFTYGGKTELTHDMDKMIAAVMDGPSSCMTRDFSIRCDDGVRRHPYAVYDPSLGWGMAVRYEDTDVMGRCLVWTDPDNEDNRGFVRSYKRERGACSHSGRDEAIDAFLTNLGYCKWSEWPDNTPLKQYRVSEGYLMPYIDGGCQNVDEDSFTINSCGDLSCSNTNGRVNAYEYTCECCGAGIDEDDRHFVGIHEDTTVGPCCIDDYTYAYSRRGNHYYIPNDRAIDVDGDYYDTDYLSDNNIVELANGDHAHQNNAVYIDSEDAYYHVDDDDICYAEDSNQYELKDNCWQCEESCKWYTDDEDYVEVDGLKYHPDNAPEVEAEEDEGEQA